MKDKGYIILKLFRKHTIPLLLLLVVMVLFFISTISSPAYAQEQIANVDCSVSVLNGTSTQKVCEDNLIISNSENMIVDFSDINVQLNSNSKLQITYIIENISNDNSQLTLHLNKINISNFKIELLVDDTFCGDLNEFTHLLKQKKTLKIQVVISIENVAQDAVLNGNLNLSIETIGGHNG